MFAFLHLEPILKNQFCFFGGGPQFGMPADGACMQNGVRQAPQAVLQFRYPCDHLRRGGLRLDVGIERDFALDLLDRFVNVVSPSFAGCTT